jgi:hypothetical protein
MCGHCEYEYWLEEIFELQEIGDYDWAADTLDGIRTWVEENEHITERQKEAIENIRDR